jgi:glucose-1-phosphate cytidylyltransferase
MTTPDRSVQVLILCGGFGTRLSTVGIDVPKPMVPIGGKPILWHIMKGFAHWGYPNFVLCLGYRSEVIKQYFLNLSMMVHDVTLDVSGAVAPIVHRVDDERNWRVTLAETGFDDATGSRVRQGSAYVPADDDLFAVTYGDGICDVDFRKVIAFHRAHGKLATVTAVHPPGQFGELTIGPRDTVETFHEKPLLASGWISGGFFVFSRKVLERLPAASSLDLEREVLQPLAHDGQLVAYRHEGFWACVDNPRDYARVSALWSGGAPWAVWGRPR